jgi:hypothetical protein
VHPNCRRDCINGGDDKWMTNDSGITSIMWGQEASDVLCRRIFDRQNRRCAKMFA